MSKLSGVPSRTHVRPRFACTRRGSALNDLEAILARLWREHLLSVAAEAYSHAVYVGEAGVTYSDVRALWRAGYAQPVWTGNYRRRSSLRLRGAWITPKGRNLLAGAVRQ